MNGEDMVKGLSRTTFQTEILMTTHTEKENWNTYKNTRKKESWNT
jgi:hypothetical protein